MSQAASEVTWLVRLLEELGVTSRKPVTLYCDNQSAFQIGKNPFFHECAEHIEIDYHFTRDKVPEGLLQSSIFLFVISWQISLPRFFFSTSSFIIQA